MLKVIMVVKDNYPNVVKVATNDKIAMSMFEEVVEKYAPKWYKESSLMDIRKIVKSISYEMESEDGNGLIVVESVVADK